MITIGDRYPWLRDDPKTRHVADMPLDEQSGDLKARPDLSPAKAIIACPHRTKASCGCSGLSRCALGKGKAGEVTWQDCHRCVTGDHEAIVII